MNNTKPIYFVVLLALVAAVSTSALIALGMKVAEFNRRYDCDVLAGVAPNGSELAKASEQPKASNRPKSAAQLAREEVARELDRERQERAAKEQVEPTQRACPPRLPDPSFGFAYKGRYLPPGGTRSIAIESILVSNVFTEVCRVEPKNIVQFLSLENHKYRNTWSYSGDRLAEDLSAGCETGVVVVADCSVNKSLNRIPVVMNDGGGANGVFLVTIMENPESSQWDKKYRLVCVSDIGLSVRSSPDGYGVWVTSLTTGLPLPGANVEIFSTANILLAKGVTDENGWCLPEKITKGEEYVIIVRSADGADLTFLACADTMRVSEPSESNYLKADEIQAYVWTERGIYRHREKMLLHVLLRNGRNVAPAPMPVCLTLKDSAGRVAMEQTLVSDTDGAIAFDGFSADEALPSGNWCIIVRTPGDGENVLGSRRVKVEEFAPPQIRVRAEAVSADLVPSNFAFRVFAEHLFGGPAAMLTAAGAVSFEDTAFEPRQWKGYAFGDIRRGLNPNFRDLGSITLDANGEGTFAAPMSADLGLPRSAVKVTAQGTVFEDGGRAVNTRVDAMLHYYPYYLGANLPGWLKKPSVGRPAIEFVCVDPDGELVKQSRKLRARIEKIDYVYSYRVNNEGTASWNSERVMSVAVDDLEITVGEDGCAACELPLSVCGDYRLSVEDVESGVAFCREFYLSDWGEEAVSARMENPTKVTIAADKEFYRVGEKPRLVVRSPFAGWAMVSVMRDKVVYTELLNLTNATSEIELRPIEREWAPNVNVSVSVIQSVAANERRLASRASGFIAIPVRPVENEIPVELAAKVDIGTGVASVTVDISAPGANAAVVTLVDEGINLLTGEPEPDPIGFFAALRNGNLPLWDIYGYILPVMEDDMRNGGIKTGGGADADMFGRVSPTPTRRFKPLAQWKSKVEVKDGRATARFELPEFKGEVRVSAIAYSAAATGAAVVREKVSPKLIMQADAPRFAAPGDRVEATMTLRNRSGTDGEVDYTFEAARCGHRALPETERFMSGKVFLKDGESTNLVFSVAAEGIVCGEMKLNYVSEGFGERHEDEIDLPVRPAVGWSTRSEVVRIEPGETLVREPHGAAHRFQAKVGGSPLAEYTAAIEWLADYPHGCLEQTCSRILPLITAGGVLNSAAAGKATNRTALVRAGVFRVLSMMDDDGFMMWPDCTYRPWDDEVSLYAAHFLVEADKAECEIPYYCRRMLMRMLRWEWSLSDNMENSAYACHTIALAGEPNLDRMLWLYDRFEDLSQLGRARLARAFALSNDRRRAEAIMKLMTAPSSVKEASFLVLALLDMNADDPRIPALIEYLVANRDCEKLSWGTTSENAHALLAIGAYYQRHPVKGGEVKTEGALAPAAGERLELKNTGTATAFVTIREQWIELSKPVTNESNGISVARRFLKSDGTAADMTAIKPGDFLVAEVTLTSPVKRAFNDLVIEDLLPAAFEPSMWAFDPVASGWTNWVSGVRDWELRTDARDDRVLIFSKRFELGEKNEAKTCYAVRVVSTGDFTLPGPVVEAMYDPRLGARRAADRVVVRR